MRPPNGEHAELLRGFPNSYGTFGYALWLRVVLEPVRPYVALRHVRFSGAGGAAAWTEAARVVAAERAYDSEPVDFCDGTWFGSTECYLTLGRWADEVSGGCSDYTCQQVYYRSIRARDRDLLTVRDYLWRWDTDWFWCS